MTMPTLIPEVEESEAEERETRRPRDKELSAIEKMIRTLEDLEPNARRDAIDYLTRRYNRFPQATINEMLERR